MNDNFKHNYKYMYNTDWRDNRELHIRRLHNLKKALTLETGDVIFTDKKIISLIHRGFSNDEIYKKNLPLNSSYKSLYSIAEKVRYECLGSKMLKGIAKNLKENYDQIIQLKRKDQLNSKEDVPVVEAFELYMLKKFLNVELNDLTNNMLNFWEKDFDKVMNKHIDFLKENLEYQNEYSSKFSEILQEMDIFKNDDNEETREENQDDGQNNPSNDDQDNN